MTRGKARAVGVNHVALEVGDIDEALTFYGRLFDFSLRGRSDTAAFIDLGDQFLALQKGRTQAGDDSRHFGLVVDDKEASPGSSFAASIARSSRTEIIPRPGSPKARRAGPSWFVLADGRCAMNRCWS